MPGARSGWRAHCAVARARGWAQPLTQITYRLTGVGVGVTPTTLTVPRGIATQLNAEPVGVDTLPAGAAIRGSLRGPSFAVPVPIQAAAAGPIYLPAFAVAGTHFLEDIRLDLGNGVVIPAQPRDVVINVLDKLLATKVTTRPLTLQELRDKNIQFDQSQLQGLQLHHRLHHRERGRGDQPARRVHAADGKVVVPPDQPMGGFVRRRESRSASNWQGLFIQPVMLEVVRSPPNRGRSRRGSPASSSSPATSGS